MRDTNRPKQNERADKPTMNTKFAKAITALNEIAVRELGAPVPRKKIKRAKRRPSAFADIKKYRREHPGVGLTEAYQAVRGNPVNHQSTGEHGQPASRSNAFSKMGLSERKATHDSAKMRVLCACKFLKKSNFNHVLQLSLTA